MSLAWLPRELPALDWIDDAARLARLSQDFSWFSPVLRRELQDKRADLAVRPRTEDEIGAVVAACALQRVPITLRGSGTGNYGQAVPLHGGLLLDLSAFNSFGWTRGGVGRAQAGIRLGDFDEKARATGWELRWLPSTFRSATLGGLFGGGFGGAGSITYGPMAADGNVLGVRVMSVEAEPQVVELRGAEAMLLHHQWGTNGIVLELEVALAPALPWLELIASFASFDAGLDFCHALNGAAPGIVKKQLAYIADPIPGCFTALAENLPPGQHAALMLVAESSEAAVRERVATHGGWITYRKDAAEVKASRRTLIEYCWNHTTLQALKLDRSLSYLQTRFDPVRQLEQARALHRDLSPELMTHLEFIRLGDGAATCVGLPLLRYSSDARLQALMKSCEDQGVRVNNPHVHVLEDSGRLLAVDAAVALKQRFDPLGLLNPGKLRSWPV